jgi:hypothetical protein
VGDHHGAAHDEDARLSLAEHGLEAIRACPICGHRAEQLAAIVERLAALI